MSTEYDRGFKDGVELATLPLYTNFISYSPPSVGEINDKLFSRRKTLLARKTTKWVIVLKAGICTGKLWDSKFSAERWTENTLDKGEVLGIYPVEIEEEL